MSARTVRRRLSSVSGLFAFLQARGDVEANPVPRASVAAYLNAERPAGIATDRLFVVLKGPRRGRELVGISAYRVAESPDPEDHEELAHFWPTTPWSS